MAHTAATVSTLHPPRSSSTSVLQSSSTATHHHHPHHHHQQDSMGCNKTVLSSMKPFLYYIVYALVNVIISVPGLYGYAAIIFNHPIFAPYRNTLSKLVILSSLVHQLAFTTFSSLHTFAIGTVQDAGLIFLSTMANALATSILDDNGTEQEVVSTVLVLLSLGTATLGLVLIVMGHFRLAE
jgi:sulfate permease, SulP family